MEQHRAREALQHLTRETIEDVSRRLGFLSVNRNPGRRPLRDPQQMACWNYTPGCYQGYAHCCSTHSQVLPPPPTYHSLRSCGTSGYRMRHHQYDGKTYGEDGVANRPNITMACAFCKSNRESYSVYSTHWLKDSTGKVTCPILRRYTCRVCGATGDDAHTDSYCPNNAPSRNMKMVLTTAKSSTGTRILK